MLIKCYKNSAVSEMGDRAEAKWAKKWGSGAVPLSVRVGGARSPSNNVAWAEAYLLIKWHPDQSSRLARIDMGIAAYRCSPYKTAKVGAAVPLSVGELGLHITQCGLGRGLPPYQVGAS